jgi:hypothetical protein
LRRLRRYTKDIASKKSPAPMQAQRNLSETSAPLAAIIEDAKARRHKAICFVTGVPRAGKTLVGLNLVTSRAKGS